MAKTSPVDFVQEVRDEAKKVVWPTRKELGVSTVMVLIMVAAASVFFLGVDAILKWVVERAILGI
jgi:preprotein translocase subunit SecE